VWIYRPNCAWAASLLRFPEHAQNHTQLHITPVRNPLKEWSARRRGRYLHNITTNIRYEHPWPQRDSNPRS